MSPVAKHGGGSETGGGTGPRYPAVATVMLHGPVSWHLTSDLRNTELSVEHHLLCFLSFPAGPKSQRVPLSVSLALPPGLTVPGSGAWGLRLLFCVRSVMSAMAGSHRGSVSLFQCWESFRNYVLRESQALLSVGGCESAQRRG